MTFGQYGRQTTFSTGQPFMVIAEAASGIDWKTGGLTLDWSTVPPNTSATPITYTDGLQVGQGNAGLPLGTVVTQIAASGLFGPWTAAAGAATTVASGGTVLGVSSLTLASGANLFPGDALLIDTAGQAETLVIASVVGNVVTFTSPTTKTHANGVAAVKTDDGRAVLAAGKCFILNQSVLRYPVGGILVAPTSYPAGLYGGSVFAARLQVGGTNQPTLAAVLAAMPRLQPVY